MGDLLLNRITLLSNKHKFFYKWFLYELLEQVVYYTACRFFSHGKGANRMSDYKDERRVNERAKAKVKVIVKGRESKDVFWEEVTETETISGIGANFFIKKECTPGKLLFLLMDMPTNYRSYDWDKELYPIWVVVQHCTKTTHKDFDGYQVGVAFVGKNAPKSYLENPLKTYRIAGMEKEGFWRIKEEKKAYVDRVHKRYDMSLKAQVSIIDSEGNETEVDENAMTQDISVGGTAVFTDIEAEVGDCVNFTCEEFDFSTICLVRNIQTKEGASAMLHLSFSEAKFPIEKLDIT